MAESVDPIDLELQFGPDLADISGGFRLLREPVDADTLAELSVAEVEEYDSDRAERQLSDARDRFKTSFDRAIAKDTPDKYGWTSHGPYNAIGDDGQIYAVRLMRITVAGGSSQYTLSKLFTTRVFVDEAAGTSTEHYREFWYVNDSGYRHIPNGLEQKSEYMIVRPIEGGPGKITHFDLDTPEETKLNELTHLVQQSPAHQRRQQGFGHTILGMVRRRPRD